MAESVVVPEKKVKKVAGPKKVKAAPTHPPTQEMVNAAITTLKERGGSSLLAIKKYVGATYKVDIQKISPFIKKYLKSAVESGKLVQTKGKGANGSFKLSKPNEKEKKQKPKPKAAKSTGAKKAVKPKVDGGQKTIKKAGEKTAKKVSGGSKATAKKAVDKKEKPKGRSGIKAKPTKTKSAITKVKVKTPKVKTTSGAKAPKVAVAAKKAKK